MEIGSVKPAVSGLVAPTPRAPAASETAVRTDLAGPKAVTDTPKGERTGYETRSSNDERAARTEAAKSARDKIKSDAASREVEREVEYDRKSEEFVFKKIDVQSGDVVQQVPEEAVLRMRAAIQAWDSVSTGRGQAPSVDLRT
ncbi:flagellar protein FlaG [Chthonobacter rhizosphaerae]|uniref:flagellar protein FlaG n=1 Tax=Chthonobacter rhizosphaerae TaxID=2735553 RepID=UPI0015EEEC10|nr:flagellar protein FlaG [Chthonobacter rhizosphaerae]